ncbi:SMAD/FHA domain-containing protein, partial [Chytridium lagenaria]
AAAQADALPNGSQSIATQVAIIALNSSFKGKRSFVIEPNTQKTIGRLMDGQEGTPAALLRFPSKVVSRNHASLTGGDGRMFIQDTKSSSGTFVNGQRLSPQGVESQLYELHDGDILKLGEDCEVNGVLHQCVVMRISVLNPPSAGDSGSTESQLNIGNQANEISYIDYSQDPQVRANVEAEFNSIWTSLTTGIESPLKRIHRLKGFPHDDDIPNSPLGPTRLIAGDDGKSVFEPELATTPQTATAFEPTNQ